MSQVNTGMHAPLSTGLGTSSPIGTDQNIVKPPVANASSSGAMVQSLATAQSRGIQSVTSPTIASVKANVQEGRSARIAQWFKEGTPRAHRTGGLDTTVTISLSNNKSCSYKNTELASMINSLPRLQRADARANLVENLSARMLRGEALTKNILDGSDPLKGLEAVTDQAASQDVADIMLFLDGKSRSADNGFTSGAFSVEDSAGRLYDFLDKNTEKYLRTSSHMTSAQKTDIGDFNNSHKNVARGIDLPKGPNGLPLGNQALLFSVIPKETGSARHIFLKPEICSGRMSTLSNASRIAGQDSTGSQERPLRFRSDFGAMFKRSFTSFVSHSGVVGMLSSLFVRDAAGVRNERIPTALKNEFKAFMKEAKVFLSDVAYTKLSANHPTSDSQGVRTMVANIRNVLGSLSEDTGFDEFEALSTKFAETITPLLSETSHMRDRIGNEVVFSEIEIQDGMTQDSITSYNMQSLVEDALFSQEEISETSLEPLPQSLLEDKLVKINAELTEEIFDLNADASAIMKTYGETIDVLRAESLDSLPEDLQVEFSDKLDGTYQAFCTKYITSNASIDSLVKSVGDTGNKEVLKNLLQLGLYSPNLIAKFKAMGIIELESMLTLVGKAQKEPSSQSLGDAWKALDSICMPVPILHKTVLALKEALIPADVQEINKEETQQTLKQLHMCLVTLSAIVGCMPSEDSQDVTTLTMKDFKKIMDNPPRTAGGLTLDILMQDAYIQLMQIENPEMTQAECINSLPLSQQVSAHACMTELNRIGVVSTAQLESIEKVVLSHLSFNKKIRTSLSRNRSDYGEVQLSLLIRKFASDIIGKPVGTGVSDETLLLFAARKLEVIEEKRANKAGKLVSVAANPDKPTGATILVDHDIAAALARVDGELRKIDTTTAMLPTMMAAQGVSTRDKLVGQTQGYSVLALQRALVSDVKQLSDHDLLVLGLNREIAADQDKLKDFVDARFGVSSGQKNDIEMDWQTSLLLSSYVNAGGKLEDLNLSEGAAKEFAIITAKSNLSEEARAAIIGKLNIVKPSVLAGSFHINLQKGMSKATGYSDIPGRALKILLRAYVDPAHVKSKGVASITVGDVSIDFTKAMTREQLGEGILAVLNSQSMSIVSTKGKSTSADYLQPVVCAHTSIQNMQKGGKSNTELLSQASKKVFFGNKNSAVMQKLSELITIDKQIEVRAELLESAGEALFKMPTFARQRLPLALLVAAKSLGVDSLSAFVSQLHSSDPDRVRESLEHLTTAFKHMGMNEELASNLAIISSVKIRDTDGAFSLKKLTRNLHQSLVTRSFSRKISERMHSSKEVRSALKLEETRESALQVIGTLDSGKSLTLVSQRSLGMSASVTGDVPITASASLALGKSEGITLWRTEDGKSCLTIDRSMFAKGGLSLGALKMLKLNVGVRAEKANGLVFSFPDDEKCAEFTSLFLTQKAIEKDLGLCERVSLGGSVTLAATVSLDLGKPHGFLGRNAIKFGVQPSAGISVTRKTIQEGTNITKSASTVYSANSHQVTHNMQVTTDLSETKLISAKNTASTIIGGKNPIDSARDYCQRMNIPNSVIEEIIAHVSDNKIEHFSLSVVSELKESAHASLIGSKIDDVVNNPDQYEFKHLTLSCSSGPLISKSRHVAAVYQASTNAIGEQQIRFSAP